MAWPPRHNSCPSRPGYDTWRSYLTWNSCTPQYPSTHHLAKERDRPMKINFHIQQLSSLHMIQIVELWSNNKNEQCNDAKDYEISMKRVC